MAMSLKLSFLQCCVQPRKLSHWREIESVHDVLQYHQRPPPASSERLEDPENVTQDTPIAAVATSEYLDLDAGRQNLLILVCRRDRDSEVVLGRVTNDLPMRRHPSPMQPPLHRPWSRASSRCERLWRRSLNTSRPPQQRSWVVTCSTSQFVRSC